MTPKAAAQLMPQQLVINTRTQEIGTVRCQGPDGWSVLIDWCEYGLRCHPYQSMSEIKRY